MTELELKWNEKSHKEIERLLADYYQQALVHIQKDINDLYTRFGNDNGLSYSDAVKLLKGKEYRTWRMDLEEYLSKYKETGDRELFREMNTLAMRSRITRLDKLYSETLMHLTDLTGKADAAMKTFLTDAYKDIYYQNLYQIGKKIGLRAPVSVVSNEQIESVLRTPWSGKNYSQRIWKDNARLGKVIQDTVVQSTHRGTSIDKLSRNISAQMDVGLSNARRLVRTELNYSENQAALGGIKESGMKYYRFSATLDRRTSSMCRSHDGNVYPIEDASPGDNMPPLHPHCRSTICGSLYGADKKKTGTRIARDDVGSTYHVLADMNYTDWSAVYVEKTMTSKEWTVSKIRQRIKETPLQRMSLVDVCDIGETISKTFNISELLGNKKKLKEVFSNFREMGGVISDDRWAPGSLSKNKQMLSDAFAVYPKTWSEFLNATGKQLYTVKASKTTRSFFSGEGAVMGNGKYFASKLPNYREGYVTINLEEDQIAAPFHEIGHYVEFFNPEALRISKEFLAKRTAGESSERLMDLFPNWGYSANEITKKDKFIHPYIGKEYSDASEVFSMGLEQIFEPTKFVRSVTQNKDGTQTRNYATIIDDEEYMYLILGMLTIM